MPDLVDVCSAVASCETHRFIVKHLSDVLNEPTPQGAAVDSIQGSEDGMLDMLKEKFPILIFSCVQLSSKLSFLGHVSSACNYMMSS